MKCIRCHAEKQLFGKKTCRSCLDKKRIWKQNNHDKDAKWRDKNRLYLQEYNRGLRKKIKNTVINQYGGKCEICNDDHMEFLTIDHINGGGRQHRKTLKISGGHTFYRFLVKNKYPTGYRVLCFNCNCVTKSNNSKNLKLKKLIFSKYSKNIECVCCQEKSIEKLTIDHINKRTNQERGWLMYRWLKRFNFPPGFQVLCFNCNCAKGSGNECPHNTL